MGLTPAKLEHPHKIWNIDNTKNKAGIITHYLDLDVKTKGIHKEMRFLITDIGKEDILLGYPWLATYEPKFKWRDATIGEEALPIIIRSVNPRIQCMRPVIAKAVTEAIKAMIIHQLETQSCIKTTSTDLAIAAEQHTKKVEIPPQYQKFAKVFSKEESQRFPPSCPWDHMIEFKKDTPDAIDCKVYPMLQSEDQGLRNWLKEQLEKGYIRPSKSQYASSFFFILKRRMESYAPYRTITGSITTLFATNIPYLLFLISSPTYRVHIYTRNWTFNGDTTMFVSKQGMNIRQRSKHAMDFTNHLSCFSDSPTPQLPSKP